MKQDDTQPELFSAPEQKIDVDYPRWEEICEQKNIFVGNTWPEISDIGLADKGVIYRPSKDCIATVRGLRKHVKDFGLRRWLAQRSYYHAMRRPHDGKDWPSWELAK